VLHRFQFIVYDEPVPQARPRFARTSTGKVHTYIPKHNEEARFLIRATFLNLVRDPWEPLQGPLRLLVTAWLPMPKSIPKKRREAALPTKRPDLDNYVKMVEDALLGYAFNDDAQIVTIEARKRYVGTLYDSGFIPGLSTTRITSPCWEVCLDEIES